MAAIPADVNPALLLWAREQSGYPSELVARRLGVKLDRIVSWELGERKPTVRQAQELAKYYHRPFGVFFLPQPPAVSPLAAEYRRLPGVQPGVESAEFRLALRVMSHRREVTLELNDELGLAPAIFNAASHIAEGAAIVGKRLREMLGITVDEQYGWRDDWQAWREWRSAIERAGVLVFQFPKVPLDQVRGVSLLTYPLPVIGINSKELAPGARVFSLVHELIHVALGLGQDERVALRERRDEAEWRDVERFAEEAASEAIIPEEPLRDLLRTLSIPRDGWNVQQVRSLAAKFRVTPLAMATRLRASGALTWDGYNAWKASWSDYVAGLPVRKGGFASPVDTTLGRGGRPFAQLVIEALDSNRITAVQASRYLDLKFDHIDKLRSELRTGATGTGPDDGWLL